MLKMLFHNQCDMLMDLDCLVNSEIELLNKISIKELHKIAIEGRDKAKENKIKQNELYLYKNKKIEFEYTIKLMETDIIFKVVSVHSRDEDLINSNVRLLEGQCSMI